MFTIDPRFNFSHFPAPRVCAVSKYDQVLIWQDFVENLPGCDRGLVFAITMPALFTRPSMYPNADTTAVARLSIVWGVDNIAGDSDHFRPPSAFTISAVSAKRVRHSDLFIPTRAPRRGQRQCRCSTDTTGRPGNDSHLVLLGDVNRLRSIPVLIITTSGLHSGLV